MEIDDGTSPRYFDPENLSTRERFRRYGKRSSGSSLSPHRERSAARISENRLNGALFMENIKQEVESIDADLSHLTPSGIQTASRRRPSLDSRGISDTDTDLIRRGGCLSLRTCKEEYDASQDSGDSTFTLFASLLDSALQGLISIPDLILHFENCCREVSESIRYGSNEMHRVMEDKLMRQKARILLDEAASWSLLWHLYGKGNEELPEDLIMLPTTSHLEACQFVVKNHTAQLCLRIVQWLEGLASKALDLDRKVRGSHVGTYLPSSGIWHHTQRFLKKGVSLIFPSHSTKKIMGNCVETCLQREITEESQIGEDEKTVKFHKEEGKTNMRLKVVLTKEELEWLLLQLKFREGKNLEEFLGEIEKTEEKIVQDGNQV